MTFERFQNLVKEKYPDAECCPHGEFAGNKINVAIIFNPKTRKVYKYNGTYCEVLNKLGIKAMYRHNYDSMVATLEEFKKRHGTKNIFFGGVVDCSRDIEEYTSILNDVDANYVIV